MEPLLHWSKTMARQPHDKLVLIRNALMSKNSSPNSLKKQMFMHMKEANHMSNNGVIRGKIMAGKSNNKSPISKRHKASPTSGRLLGPFIDCVTIQGLNFSGFVVVVVVVVVVADLFLRLLENLKLWKWMMHQYKMGVKKKRDETRRKAVGGRKWTWIGDLLSGLDVSGIDDLFISICILMGLGFLCGLLALARRFDSKNVEI